MSHQDMGSYIHLHRTLNDNGTETDDSNVSDWRHWKDGHMYAMSYPACATRTPDADTTTTNTASLLEAQNNFSIAESVFDDGFTAPIRNFNGYLDHFGSPGFMLPPTGSFVLPFSQLGEWSCLSSPINPQGALQPTSSVPVTYQPSVQSDIAIGPHSYIGTVNSDDACNISPSASVNNGLLWMHGDSYAMPSGNDYGHTMNHEFFENCIADLQHDAPYSLLQTEMTAQHLLSNRPRPEMTLSSLETGTLFAGEQGWNLELPGNEMEISPLSIPGHQYSNNQSHVPDASIISKTSSSSAPGASNTVGKNALINRPLKARQILPREIIQVERGIGTWAKITKRRGRNGRLPEKKRAKAFKMRHKKACASCFASHVECSEEDPCLRCANSPRLGFPCNRDSLVIYMQGLAPPFLGEHLDQGAIEKFTNYLEFINNEIFVELSTGSSHPPIRLLVCEFIPKNRILLNVPDSTPKSQNNVQCFPEVRSLQWGVHKRNADQLKPRCLEHIQIISNRDTVIGERNSLSWKIMQAICRFQQADPIARMNDLLSKAISVNRLHYVLGTNIFFNLDSIDMAISSLQTGANDISSRSRISSRVLTKQIKGVMNDLLNEFTKELLDQYNGELRDKRPETRLLCLMTHLILSMCAEQIQTQVDSFIVFRIPKGACNPIIVRECGTEVCRRVEHVVLEHSWVLLKGKLKALLGKRNPFKYGYEADEGQVPKESEMNLINEIRQAMNEHEKEVFEKALDPYYGGSSRTPDDTDKFRKSNSNRLLSKYLKKLY